MTLAAAQRVGAAGRLIAVDIQPAMIARVWAKVRGENDWEGWVDGRLLEQLDPSGRNPDRRAYVLLGVAVAVLVVVALLGLVGGS
jgi:hypothetical protein